jgi:hypothetical protein
MLGTTRSFPETYRDISTERLLHSFQTAPARLRAALTGLTRHQLTAYPIEDKWSILEIALHLTDSELMGATRIRMAVAEPGREFLVYDQDRWTRELRHNAASQVDLETSLALFGCIRANVHQLLSRAPAESWRESSGIHPELGPLTLRNLLELYADHGERHLAQIAERRRLLGVPVDVAIMLPTRLY